MQLFKNQCKTTHFACLMSLVAIVTASHCNAAQRERGGGGEIERGKGRGAQND